MKNLKEKLLICADCLEILPEMEDDSVDLVVTDPEYFPTANDDYGRMSEIADEKSYAEFSESWIREVARILKPTGSLSFFRRCCLDDEKYSGSLFDFQVSYFMD